MDRKLFLRTSGILSLGIVATKGKVLAAGNITPFVPEKLAYNFNALEPNIDAETMTIHYTKHYQAYIDNLNKALPGSTYVGKDIKTIIQTVKATDAAVRNNAGGFYNHSFFWRILSPETQTIPPHLEKAITDSFGSVDDFKTAFEKAGLSVFGSGWAWLVKDGNGKLKIVTTPNQDNPMMSFVADRGFPILGIDVWEHAYYLKYQNLRKDYLHNFWNVVNWKYVHELFMA